MGIPPFIGLIVVGVESTGRHRDQESSALGRVGIFGKDIIRKFSFGIGVDLTLTIFDKYFGFINSGDRLCDQLSSLLIRAEFPNRSLFKCTEHRRNSQSLGLSFLFGIGMSQVNALSPVVGA